MEMLAATDGYRHRNTNARDIISATTTTTHAPSESVPPGTGTPSHTTRPGGTAIIDIRSSDASPLANLDTQILDALLLWDEKGQELYDEILTTPHYYPYRIENQLISQRITEIATTIAASETTMLVELGAGSMVKTAQLLTALDSRLSSPLVYYALDVDLAQLESSLALLKQGMNLRHIALHGLHGTYEDGAKWLARPEAAVYRKTLVWLGSSMANVSEQEAGELLGSFVTAPDTGALQNLAGFLVAVDGCQDATRIQLAYDVPGGQSRRWVLYGLEAARRQLGGGRDDAEIEQFFAPQNWKFDGRWEPDSRRYENYLVPTRQLDTTIRGKVVRLEQGERVRILGSGKWAKSDIARISAKQGLEIQNTWKSPELDYSIYWLQPILRRHDSGVDMAGISDGGNNVP
ncbi:histidine-specific methyltransferase [Cercophora scortea]|uniref:Histidine-specific methyltransferase n=1 Tax=Cercophora scortea TaxID=314031 RepID=A0AAE0IHG1_9PEZI|nr:histidine-specific methyltransferase [Cercophora scortea]